MSAQAVRPSVVVVGGGHGCSRSLAALRRLEVERSAIVTVADDGGSSGRLRRDHDVVALGDLRMAMLALAEEGEDAAALLGRLAHRRFSRGELAGHSLGNLIILGLLDEHEGDLLAALDAFGSLVGASGRVIPASVAPVTLVAETATGTVAGQAAVATARRIRDVRLDPAGAPAAPGAAEAVRDADLVLLGPGSLYTSILPVLLVPDLAEAVRTTAATTVLVGNLREQPGETEGMDLADHVEALHRHVPGLRIDVVLAHERDGAGGDREGGRGPLAIDAVRLDRMVGRVARADMGDERDGHDPDRLATLVERLLRGAPTGRHSG